MDHVSLHATLIITHVYSRSCEAISFKLLIPFLNGCGICSFVDKLGEISQFLKVLWFIIAFSACLDLVLTQTVKCCIVTVITQIRDQELSLSHRHSLSLIQITRLVLFVAISKFVREPRILESLNETIETNRFVVEKDTIIAYKYE